MGRDARIGLAAALLTVVAAALTPTLPWHVAPLLLALAAVAAWDRAWLWCAVGAAVVWAPAIAPVGVDIAVELLNLGGAGFERAERAHLAAAGLLVAGLALAVHRWRALSTALVVTAVALVAKQLAAAEVLPAAFDVTPWVGGALAGAAVAASAARGTRAEAGALAIAAAIVLVRLAGVWSVDGVDRVRAADRIDAVDLVYDALAAEALRDGDNALAEALVRAAPERDGAVAALGWARALDAGWRPARAEGVVIEVARALESRGRGGEALRLLAKHPRAGEIDALRALFERLQGAPVRWKGAALGPELPGRFDPALRFQTNGWAAIELTARAPLAALVLEGEGTSFEGAPLVEVRLDGGPVVPWSLDGPSTLRLDGPIEPGPHRLDLTFVNDRAEAQGDRNVTVRAVVGEPAVP